MRALHLKEIFGTYGQVKDVDLPLDRRNGLHLGSATVVFNEEKEAEQAMFYMDGGQIDGNTIKVSFVLVQAKKRSPSPEPKEAPRKAEGRAARADDKHQPRPRSEPRNEPRAESRAEARPERRAERREEPRSRDPPRPVVESRRDRSRSRERQQPPSRRDPPPRPADRRDMDRDRDARGNLSIYGPGTVGGRGGGSERRARSRSPARPPVRDIG